MDNKRAIVTGASSGIGREIVRQLAEDGWRVLAVARRAERLKELEKDGSGRIVGFPADISAEGAAEAVVSAAAEKIGGLDLLVNNAGTSWVGPFAGMPTEKIDEVMHLNVRALMLMCRAAIPILEKSEPGQIINVSSIADRIPMEGLAVYCSSKAAVSMFTKVLAKELAPKKIRVNLLAPCGTDTEIFDKAGVKIDSSHLVSPREMAELVGMLIKVPQGIDLPEIITQRRFEPV
jgi:NAD(P)-dependent dehydrogenase (short-subunit alcohol dehydrogenase family)